MGTDNRFIRSYLLYRNDGRIGKRFIFLRVGRGKVKRLFPLVLLSGSEGVGKP